MDRPHIVGLAVALIAISAWIGSRYIGTTSSTGTTASVLRNPTEERLTLEGNGPSSRNGAPTSHVTIEASKAGNEKRDALSPEEQKIDILRRLIQEVEKFNRLANALLNQNPALRDLHQTIADLHRLPDKVAPEGNKEWKLHVANAPSSGEKLFKIMHLMRPSVTLAMMDDPKYGPIMKDVFDVAGLRNTIDTDLVVLDGIAGFDGEEQKAGQTLAEFRESLEAREMAYERASKEIEKLLPTPCSEQLKNYMHAEIQKQVMVPYLELYYDSFFVGDLLAAANSIQSMQRKLQAMSLDTPLTKKLLRDYADLLKRSPPLPKR